MKENFHLNRDKINNDKIKALLKELPDFCYDYFMALESRTSSLTRLNYAYDLRNFFHYLVTENAKYLDKKVLTLEDIETLEAQDIERYLHYLSYYEKDGKLNHNGVIGKSRKLSSIKTLLTYLFKKDLISKNISEKVEAPKLNTKPIIQLNNDEVKELFDVVESGQGLSQRQRAFNHKTKKRDVAMLTLFLTTGIRISECVGLNIDDLDFKENALKVTRKGGNSTILYFGEEAREALLDYLEEREINDLDDGDTYPALFLSTQKKRISVRAVENIVKKYASLAVPLKKITPHKLRSTYGTNLYRATKDIYIVAEVLGHKDVNTTKKHYAKIDDDIKRSVADKVSLKDN